MFAYNHGPGAERARPRLVGKTARLSRWEISPVSHDLVTIFFFFFCTFIFFSRLCVYIIM